MRTKIVAGLTLCLALLLAACGSGTGTSSTTTSTRDLAPDFLTQPRLEQIPVVDALDGDFDWVEILGFADDRHVLVWGSNGQGTETGTLGLLNLDTREPEWQLDLIEQTGFVDMVNPHATFLGDGSMVLPVSEVLATGRKVLLAVSAEGEVTGVRSNDDYQNSVLGATGGYVVLATGDDVVVTKGSDFVGEVWRVEAPAEADVREDMVLVGEDDAFYVLTKDGYADGPTGRLLGWGNESSNLAEPFQVLSGNVVVRIECGDDNCSLMRIDPTDGRDMWDQDQDGAPVGAVDGVVVVVGSDGKTLRGIAAADGKERWAATIGDARSVRSVAVLNSGHMALFFYTDTIGAVLVSVKDGKESRIDGIAAGGEAWDDFRSGLPSVPGLVNQDGERKLVSGQQVLYTLDGDDLVAFSVTGDSNAPLWSLRLDGNENSISLVPRQGRLFLVRHRDMYWENVEAAMWEVVGS